MCRRAGQPGLSLDLGRLSSDDRVSQLGDLFVAALLEHDPCHPDRTLLVRDHRVDKHLVELLRARDLECSHVAMHPGVLGGEAEVAVLMAIDAAAEHALMDRIDLFDLGGLAGDDRISELLNLSALTAFLGHLGHLNRRFVVAPRRRRRPGQGVPGRSRLNVGTPGADRDRLGEALGRAPRRVPPGASAFARPGGA